jgi:hypothetical protein
VVGDDLVSLDVDAGDYACLSGIGRAVPPQGPGGRLDLMSSEAADMLLEAGFATPEQSPDARTDLPPPATTSCWRAECVVTTSADRRRFVRVCLTATPRFWRAPFRALVASARRSRPSEPAPPLAVQRDAQVFDQLLPLAPFQGECLFRASLLLAYLRLDGRDASWVFGVRTYPFQAHCWLQVGDMVLNDAVERICGYTPIFAV